MISDLDAGHSSMHSYDDSVDPYGASMSGYDENRLIDM